MICGLNMKGNELVMNNGYYNPCYLNYSIHEGQKPGRLKVNGTGFLKAEPDTVLATLGIITENKDLDAAQKENQAKSRDVLDSLYKAGIPKENIKTAAYSIQPEYDYVEGKQVFRAYVVTNMLSVTMTELDETGKVIDNAVSSGANSVSSIKFTISDPSKYYDRALKMAVIDATAKANEICSALGTVLNEVPVSVAEEGSMAAPLESPALKAYADGTSILPGQITITARIQAVYSYSPQY